MEEGEIVSKIKDGNEEYFIELVNQYKKKVISLCYSYTQDHYEAEDLSQEVFLCLYSNINKFRGDCSLSTYIYKIGVSKCLDYKRKRSIKKFLTGLAFIYKAPECDLESKDYIRQSILSLSQELKIPVVLYYYIGLSQKEIADILNVSTKTVEGRIYRAKQKLKVELKKEGFDLCRNSGTV